MLVGGLLYTLFVYFSTCRLLLFGGFWGCWGELFKIHEVTLGIINLALESDCVYILMVYMMLHEVYQDLDKKTLLEIRSRLPNVSDGELIDLAIAVLYAKLSHVEPIDTI